MIKSLLDMDFYKFTMGYLVFKKHRNVPVKYQFIDRRNIGLASFIPYQQLLDEIERIQSMRFSRTEIHYLRGTNEYANRMFDEEYLEFLSNLRLPRIQVTIGKNADYIFTIEGVWSEAIYWETLILSTINELYYKNIMSAMGRLRQEAVWSQGVLNLLKKADRIRGNEGLVLCDFGTRRRFSQEWQWHVLGHMKDLPQFKGTSNTLAALEFGLLPIGTSAHEMYMGMAGIMGKDNLVESHRQTLKEWWDVYGYGLSIALTDTYTNKFFLQDFTSEQAAAWKGVRHDSGNPIQYGRDVIDFYKRMGIDPKTKMIVFSDGLTLPVIEQLYTEFSDQIKLSFGWGTDLTNDLGLPNLQIVIKLCEANGNPVVKLSDNPEKAMGPKELVDHYRKVFTEI